MIFDPTWQDDKNTPLQLSQKIVMREDCAYFSDYRGMEFYITGLRFKKDGDVDITVGQNKSDQESDGWIINDWKLADEEGGSQL